MIAKCYDDERLVIRGLQSEEGKYDSVLNEFSGGYWLVIEILLLAHWSQLNGVWCI